MVWNRLNILCSKNLLLVHIAVQLKEYEITDCVNSAQVILTIPMFLFI